jgi:transposase InsO family protein
MPWLETNVRDQRIQFVMTARRPDTTVAAACRAFGISRKTGYKWLRREAEAGSVAVLSDRPRRPHRSPTRTEAAITDRIGELRAMFGWGGEKLAVLLAAEGIQLASRTIDRIIQREGWTRQDASPAPALHRFTHAAPNDLWQMDAKGAYPLASGGRCHALSIIDDHSRFAVGLTALPTLETDAVRAALTRAFERHGVPTAMLMDHGTPWWSTKGPAGLTTLGVFLLKQGIRLTFGAIRHPQTQGKVERFHRTLAERLRWTGVPDTLRGFQVAFAQFCDEYNCIRPHEALGLDPPALHFQRSARSYQAHPRPWMYPRGLLVRRITPIGQVQFQGGLYFVSEALRGEDVACVPHDDRVLVMYRHMFVRELHPRSRHSVPLMRPVTAEWPVEAAGPVDAQNAPTGPWKTQRARFPQLPPASNVLPMS